MAILLIMTLTIHLSNSIEFIGSNILEQYPNAQGHVLWNKVLRFYQ